MDKKRKLANNAKAVTAKGGKYLFKGVKLAGIGLLTATDLASKGADKIVKNPNARKLASKAALIAACIAFPSVAATMATVGITTTAINYMYHNCIEGRKTTAIESAENIARISDKVLDKTLSLVAVPAHLIAKGINETSRMGKDALKKSLKEQPKLDEAPEL